MSDRAIASPEIQEIHDFLKVLRPFDMLDDAMLIKAAKQVRITYHQAGSEKHILDYDNPTLFIVRTGAFDVKSPEGELLDRVISGGFFGFASLLTGSSKNNSLSVYEDGLLYRLDQSVFQTLRHSSLEFDQFFTQAYEKRLRVGLQRRNENSAMAMRVSQVMADALFSVAPDTSILDTVRLMTEKNFASVAILDENQHCSGIFTDKDIRTRVVAQQLDVSMPIETVMTRNPISIDKGAFVHEAMVLMIRNNIKHLPVVEHGKAVSMVTVIDLVRNQRSDPVLIIGQIYKANSVDELVSICEKIPELLLHLIKMDVRADDLGRILTTVTGALTRRLIALAQQQYGAEPVPFVWLAFGSQGRQDQSAKSDQDNGLLLDDTVLPEHDAYFEELAKFVNHGLDACGYVYCPGEIMAQNTKWRLSLSSWLGVFRNWINAPTTKALMHASIFFDMRAIYVSEGAEHLFDQLQNPVLELAGNQAIFLAMLTRNALDLTPPLGFFNRLVLDHNGEHKNTLDIKLRGMMPITDIARIHALAHGVKAVNTRERIDALIEKGALHARDGANLLDAQEYIAHQRLLHQGEQLGKGQQPDNHMNPNDFSPLIIRHLKDAFQVVRDAQSGIRQTYTGGVV